MTVEVHRSRGADLPITTLYALLQLRVDVFVVEQECPYRELDGRDLEPDTWHLWTEDSRRPSGYLRLLDDPDGVLRIGRVCTRADARGTGLAARLVEVAVSLADGAPIVLDAQTYLVPWYLRFGFRPGGPQFVEDGIAHVPMRRPGASG